MDADRRTVIGLTAAALSTAVVPDVANAAPPPNRRMPRMKVQDVFALITTNKMDECKIFYARHFGFEVAFESPIYLQLSIPSEDGQGRSLAFMPTNHPFGVVGPEPFNGHGLMLTLQVADAATLYGKIKAEGGNIIHALKTEAWGQRRFTMRDPAGVAVDVVQSDGIETQPGYYEQFTPKTAKSDVEPR